jgi:hypothetical protein
MYDRYLLVVATLVAINLVTFLFLWQTEKELEKTRTDFAEVMIDQERCEISLQLCAEIKSALRQGRID